MNGTVIQKGTQGWLISFSHIWNEPNVEFDSYGYAGIVVAMLAAQNPIGVVGAAIFVAIVFVGADGMSRALGVPSFIADVIVAISLLTMLISLMLTTYRVRR